jgi:hypothetical protein
MIYSILVIVALVVFVLTLGMEGIWSGVLMTINVIIAGIVATTFYEPLAQWLQGMYFGGHFYWDTFTLGGIFAVTAMALRHMTDFLAPRRLMFPERIDQAGGIVMALICGWITIGFSTMALQTAPMEVKPLWGSFEPERSNFLGMAAPDYQWMQFFQYTATGALAPFSEQEPKDLFYERNAGEIASVYVERRKIFSVSGPKLDQKKESKPGEGPTRAEIQARLETWGPIIQILNLVGGLGSLLAFAGWVWMLVLAFKTSVMWGVASIIPLIAVIFGIKHSDDAGKPLGMMIGGLCIQLGVILVAFLIGVMITS